MKNKKTPLDIATDRFFVLGIIPGIIVFILFLVSVFYWKIYWLVWVFFILFLIFTTFSVYYYLEMDFKKKDILKRDELLNKFLSRNKKE